MTLAKKLAAAVAVILWLPAAAPAQEVFQQITSERLEDILRGLNIQFTKGGDNKGTTWYDFTSNKQQLRLTNYSGKDIMIDVQLPKVDWEFINRWNGAAKFSRARLSKDGKGVENAVIESNLDLVGGVTEGTIKHFVRSFDHEVTAWMKDLSTSTSTAVKDKEKAKDKGNLPTAKVLEEETFKTVSTDRIEKIFKNLNITFKKEQRKGSNTYFYDFNRNNFEVRLTTFGGTDLMIDCVFSIPADQAANLNTWYEKANKWNLTRNYIRTVIYPGGGKPYVSLESNLDCAGGISENMIQYFITSFDDETRLFDEFLKKK